MFRIEHNVETGEIKKIELSSEEIAEVEKQWAESRESKKATIEQELAVKSQKIALLERLGITEEEAKLLLG